MFNFRKWATFAALSTVVAAEVDVDVDGSTCSSTLTSIANQSDLDAFQNCTIVNGVGFGINHTYTGAFVLPRVQSIPAFIVGYLGPKLSGSSRVEDGVTSISMPDLEAVIGRGVLFGYLNNLTSISFPKLERANGDFVVVGSPALRNLTLPALSNLAGAIDLDGPFDYVDFPSLKTVSYMRVVTTGKINCPALGQKYANLAFRPRSLDTYRGIVCTTVNDTNRWNSSDPSGNPTVEQAAAVLNGSAPASNPNTKTGSASGRQMDSLVSAISLALVAVAILA